MLKSSVHLLKHNNKKKPTIVLSKPAPSNCSSTMSLEKEIEMESEVVKKQRYFSLGIERGDQNSSFDDDGRVKRTGTLATASAHIITTVIGSGVLSLAWAVAQLGWIVGPVAILTFSVISWFTATFLADCYRSPDPVTGRRHYTYMDVVKANLGGVKVQLCGIVQYVNLIGVTIGYAITASISMVAIKRSNCFHKHGHRVGCHTSNNLAIIMFGVAQIILCQLPDFHKLSVLSIIDAVTSLSYISIGLCLSVAKVAGEAHVQSSLTGTLVGKDMSRMDKMWNIFSALGNIAFAYSQSYFLTEIQDTLQSDPPENKVMKRASTIGISISTVLYMLCGLLAYAAFGDNAPENLLAGFGFFEPFWLVNLANLCVVVHIVGGYQKFCQPIFGFVEHWTNKKWPNSRFINGETVINFPYVGPLAFSYFRLVWRTAYVIFTTVLAMMFPFFNDVVGLLGAASFWPLTVYFPIQIFIARAKIPKYSSPWIWMLILNVVCLVLSLLAAAGSLHGLVKSLQNSKLFDSVSKMTTYKMV